MDLGGKLVTIQRGDALIAAITARDDGRLRVAVFRPLDAKSAEYLIGLGQVPQLCMEINSMGLRCGLCGLRASSRERGRSEEWLGESGMWPGTGNSGGWRSPQASAGTPNNTREPVRQDKKKPQPRTVGVSLLVVEHGTEPASVIRTK